MEPVSNAAVAAAAVPVTAAARPPSWHAYLLRCADGTLYAGVSTDVAQRCAAHQSGRGARYTRSRRPVVVVWMSPALSKVLAHRLEYRIKRLSRLRKQALIAERISADSVLTAVMRINKNTKTQG